VKEDSKKLTSVDFLKSMAEVSWMSHASADDTSEFGEISRWVILPDILRKLEAKEPLPGMLQDLLEPSQAHGKPLASLATLWKVVVPVRFLNQLRSDGFSGSSEIAKQIECIEATIRIAPSYPHFRHEIVSELKELEAGHRQLLEAARAAESALEELGWRYDEKTERITAIPNPSKSRHHHETLVTTGT
jgi:hypothetical protein